MSINDVQNSEYTIYSDGNQIEVDMLGKTAKSIELYSVNGTLVARRQYRNSIATNTLPHGIYVLIITDDKNVKTVKKLRLWSLNALNESCDHADIWKNLWKFQDLVVSLQLDSKKQLWQQQ